MLVLVADPDHGRRRVTERLLVELGHGVLGVDDRDTAIAWIAERDCDLVIADARLAMAEEFELVRTIRLHWRRLPIVLVVPGVGTGWLLEAAFDLGVSACVPDPPATAALRCVLGFPFIMRTDAERPAASP